MAAREKEPNQERGSATIVAAPLALRSEVRITNIASTLLSASKGISAPRSTGCPSGSPPERTVAEVEGAPMESDVAPSPGTLAMGSKKLATTTAPGRKPMSATLVFPSHAALQDRSTPLPLPAATIKGLVTPSGDIEIPRPIAMDASVPKVASPLTPPSPLHVAAVALPPPEDVPGGGPNAEPRLSFHVFTSSDLALPTRGSAARGSEPTKTSLGVRVCLAMAGACIAVGTAGVILLGTGDEPAERKASPPALESRMLLLSTAKPPAGAETGATPLAAQETPPPPKSPAALDLPDDPVARARGGKQPGTPRLKQHPPKKTKPLPPALVRRLPPNPFGD